MRIEKIVRPFETKDVTPPRKYIASKGSRQTTAQNAVLEVGKSAQVTTATESYSNNSTFYMDTVHKETNKDGVVGGS